MFQLFRTLFNLFRRSPQKSSRKRPKISSKKLDSQSPSPGNSMRPTDPTTQSSNNDLEGSSVSLGNQQTSLKNLKLVLNVLRAYIVTFGQPNSDLELRAIVGAIVANLPAVLIENSRLEAFIDRVLTAYESIGKEASLVDVTSQLLAEQVSVWLQEQETIVGNVLSAYLQRFAPEDSQWEDSQILSLVQTVIATLNDGSLSRSGGRALIERVIENFDIEQALSHWVAPKWIALAQKVASYTSKEDIQQEVQSIAWAYLQQFQAILSPQLIEQIMKRGPINLSAEEVLAGDFGEFSEMLYYKYQFLKADPVVTKSHREIASNVHQAIADLKNRRRQDGEVGIDVTEGIEGDLEIKSPFTAS